MQVLEKARVGRLLGAALEARILLFVGDEGLRQRLAALDAAANGADPLRYAFIVSQVGVSRPDGHACVTFDSGVQTYCCCMWPGVVWLYIACAAGPRWSWPSRLSLWLPSMSGRSEHAHCKRPPAISFQQRLFAAKQVDLLDSPAEAQAAEYTAALQLPGGGGELVIGVARARGGKCSRCWNYSEQARGLPAYTLPDVHAVLCGHP